MNKKNRTIPPEIIELYDNLIDNFSEFERKGKTTPYTSANGYMFSFLTKEGMLGLRLSKDDREKFLADHETKLMEQHGRIMKEFVKVPDTVLNDTETIILYIKKSYDYVLTLKPK